MTEFTKEQLEQEMVDAEERTSVQLRASPEVRTTRYAACSACPAKETMFGLDSCAECKCVIGLKVFVIAATCPRGKW